MTNAGCDFTNTIGLNVVSDITSPSCSDGKCECANNFLEYDNL
jgi:hypothetical protein